MGGRTVRESRMLGWRALVSLLVGVVFGAFASISNLMQTPVTFVLNAGWAWAAIPVAAGLTVRRPVAAAWVGPLTAAAAVLAYYAVDSLVRQEDFWLYSGELAYWALAIVVVGPVLGVVGASIHAPRVTGLLAGLVVPLGAVAEMVLLPRWPDGPHTTDLQVARIVTWIAAALVLGALILRFRRQRLRGQRERDTRPST